MSFAEIVRSVNNNFRIAGFYQYELALCSGEVWNAEIIWFVLRRFHFLIKRIN